MITYKGYIGHYSFDEKNLFQGNIANSSDGITFQGKSVSTTQQAFREAVNQYIEWCKQYSKEPNKHSPYGMKAFPPE